MKLIAYFHRFNMRSLTLTQYRIVYNSISHVLHIDRVLNYPPKKESLRKGFQTADKPYVSFEA